MALTHASFVEETTTTTGTGTLSLGGATAGNRTFVAAVGDGNTCWYGILSSDGQYETGLGTVTDGSPDTLARTSVLASSTGTALDLPAGTHRVYATLPAEKFTPADIGAAAVDDTRIRTYAVELAMTPVGARLVANDTIAARIPVSGTVINAYVDAATAPTGSAATFSIVTASTWGGTPATLLSANISLASGTNTATGSLIATPTVTAGGYIAGSVVAADASGTARQVVMTIIILES